MVALWASSSLIHIAPAITAFCGLGILLLTGVITWEDLGSICLIRVTTCEFQLHSDWKGYTVFISFSFLDKLGSSMHPKHMQKKELKGVI